MESYITSRFRPENVLNNVADSFPAAAPYYASYFLMSVLEPFGTTEYRS